MYLILLDIEIYMPMIRVWLNMISLITGRLHPESQIVHTARHRAKYRHHRVFSIDNIRIIAA